MASSRLRPPVVRSVRTPEAIAALRATLDDFDPGARQRGREYYQSGAVLKVWSEADHHVKAEVEGGARYYLTLFYTRGEWSTRCTCPVGADCKHAYAAGLAWIESSEAGMRDGRDPAEAAAIALAAHLPKGPVKEMLAAQALEAEVRSWLSALEKADGEVGERAMHPVLQACAGGLRVRLQETGGWNVELRGGADKPWRGPTQKWFRDIAAMRPADFEGLPAAEAALAVALAAECRLANSEYSSRLGLPIPAVDALLRMPAVRSALVMPDGGPLVIEAEPLVPEGTVMAGVPDRLELRLVTPDGRLAQPAVLVATRPVPLYWFDERVWRGPPAVPSLQLPVAALEDARLRPRLRAVGLRLPVGLAAEVREVKLRARLRCWVAPALGGGERDFHAQLTASSDAPPCEQIWADPVVGGWRWGKNSAPPPRVAGEPVWEFDFGDALAASRAMGGFRLGWDGWAESWMRPVTDAFPEEFLAWHAGLPAGLDVELSPELASLLGEPLRARVELSIAHGPDSEQDWFDLSVGLKVEDTTLSAEEVALLLKARGKWVHLPRHGWRRVETDTGIGASEAAALDRLGLGVDDVVAGGRPVRHRLHALQLALEAEALAVRDAAMVHVLQDRAAKIMARPEPELPAGLKATLRPYQREGFQFLAHLSAQGFGGVLADDMGLGKTVQALAWLLHLAEAPRAEGAGAFRVLVVCPKSVTHGWLAEAERFAPGLGIAPFKAGEAPPKGVAVVVANYTQLRLNAAKFRAEGWDAVVLDEGQFIKNPGSQVAVAARALRARHRVVLTGTPIENRLADLWSLFAFAQPGLLGEQAGFRRQYNEADPAALARLHRRVRHFLLRRTKAQAAPDLPPRTEDEIVVELEGGQKRLYEAELKRARAHLLGVETKSALDAVRFHVLASLLRLRQICCHPALVDGAHAGLPSAKLEALMERIEELAEEGHQVLVFSQFVEMLQIIRTRLEAGGIGHLILTGATENRAELVETFQTDKTKTVFLLSLKAAGFGLNLTAASYAILFDPWWNPAAEAQAIDRIHRIGQTKPVIAYRLIAEGTVEEKIRLLQREKAALAAAVVQEESLAAVMDLDSLRRILA